MNVFAFVRKSSDDREAFVTWTEARRYPFRARLRGVATVTRLCPSITITGIALATGGPAFGESAEAQRMRSMISAIEFITQNSALEYAGQPLPDVTFVRESELQAQFRTSEASRPSLQGDHSSGHVAAFYDRHRNQIFLSDETSINGPGLLHELVHYLQHTNGKDNTFASHPVCLEAEAYDLQAIWQAEHGIDLASMPDYGFVMTLYGVCNDADFSWVKGSQLP